jgi:hypothetical protein
VTAHFHVHGPPFLMSRRVPSANAEPIIPAVILVASAAGLALMLMVLME